MKTIKKLDRMPYANAHVEVIDNNIYLFSYVTLVAQIENNILSVFGLYSMTTRRHISAFMREYTTMGYSTAKTCYEDNVSIDIETGEVFNN